MEAELVKMLQEAEARGDRATAEAILIRLEGIKAESGNVLQRGDADNSGGGNTLPAQEGAGAVNVPRHNTQGLIEHGQRYLEPAFAIAGDMVKKPIGGLAGIATQNITNPLPLPGEMASNAQAVEKAVDDFTAPRSPAGKQGLSDLQGFMKPVSDFVSPFFQRLDKGAKQMGDATLDATGSPALATAAEVYPSASMEALAFLTGGKTAKSLSKAAAAPKAAKVKKLAKDAVPYRETLKSKAGGIFDELDQMGVSVKPESYSALARKIKAKTARKGIDKDVTPGANKAVERIMELDGTSPTLSEIDTLRNVAKGAAGSTNKTESMLGNMIIDELDNFYSNASKNSLIGADPKLVAAKYKQARELWRRQSNAKLIEEAMEKAKNQASGLENGIRVQFRAILNNPKKSKFLNAEEKAAMRQVVEGTKGANIAKFLGRFGMMEGGSTGSLMTLLGGGGGATAGSMLGGAPGAAIGAITVPLVGQVSRGLAQRLTMNSARFADEVIRAGKDAKRITAAYMKNTKAVDRSPQELAELFMETGADLEQIGRLEIAQQAARIAAQRQGQLAGSLAASSAVE